MRNAFSSDALSGRKAIVFAASRGIGKSTACKLACMGADVVLMARSAGELEKAAVEISGQVNARVRVEVADLLDEQVLTGFMSRHLDADILVTNCGGPPVVPFEQLSIDDWDNAYRMIVRSVVLACRQLVPAMAARGWGRVVMLASSVVVDPMRNFALSTSLRKSLLGLAESLAEEYAERGVTANLVCPGLTKTGRMQALVDGISQTTGNDKSTVLNSMLSPIAAKRMADPVEIAAAVAFLASEESGFIQGQALLVDGGQSVNP